MNDRPAYVTSTRRFMVTWFVTFLVLLLLNIITIQWVAYVDKKSTERQCRTIALFESTNAVFKNVEVVKLQKEYKCK